MDVENPQAFPGYTDKLLMDPKSVQCVPLLHGGMTLRDWFAGMAMAAVINNNSHYGNDDEASTYRADQSKVCYAYADAMLAERMKGKQ